MTAPEGLTKMMGEGRNEIYAGLGKFVPQGWEWTQNPSLGWHAEKVPDSLKPGILMCRARRKHWTVGVPVAQDDEATIYAGSEPTIVVKDKHAGSLASRLAAYLNGEDPYHLVVHAIADAQKNNPQQNLLPHLQECRRLADETRTRIASYG